MLLGFDDRDVFGVFIEFFEWVDVFGLVFVFFVMLGSDVWVGSGIVWFMLFLGCVFEDLVNWFVMDWFYLIFVLFFLLE